MSEKRDHRVIEFFQRLFGGRREESSVSLAELERVLSDLPRVEMPSGDLRLLATVPQHTLWSQQMPDTLNYSVYATAQRDRFWIHVRGGIAGLDHWYGPFDRADAEKLNLLCAPEEPAP